MIRTITNIFISLSIGFAFTGIYSDGAANYKVKGGKVKVNKITYPIYKGVSYVEDSYEGIMYGIMKKSKKAALKEAKKIMKFYKGKKINKIKLPKFKKSGKPETTAWISSKCSKKGGVEAIVKLAGKDIYIFIVPNCGGLETFVL